MGKKKKILIVDDERIILRMLQIEVESRNHIAILAESGQRALELVGYENPDLITLDIMMPGMSGFQVCQELKSNEKSKHIPVIIFTARSDDEAKKLAEEAKADAYIVKPFESKEFFNIIDEQLKINVVRKIIIISADMVFSNNIKTVLEDTGEFKVQVTNDILQAALLSKEEKPQVILLDVILSRLKGNEAIKGVRAQPEMKDIPIIVMTDLMKEEIEKHSNISKTLLFDADNYVSKTCQPEALIKIIHESIHKIC